jgi:hypothetical protein
MLEKITNVCVVVVSMVFCAFVWLQFQTYLEGRASKLYAPGDAIDTIADLAASDRQTLFMYLASTCKYCNDSMWFYKSLLEHNAQAGSHTKIVALSIEPIEMLRKYLSDNGLRTDDVASVRLKKLKGTPTLLLVRNSRVTHVWEGLMEATAQAELINLIAQR